MNIRRLFCPFVALFASIAPVLSSCGPEWHADSIDVGGGYGGAYASAGWSNSRYDDAGFPIYGYYDGRPVYGYSSLGSPIFSFSLLTSSCYVPSWGPAPYYCGHWHYPRHIYRRPLPPRYPHHHHPGMRPPASHPHNFPPDKRPSFNPGNRPHRPVQPGAAWPNRPGSGNSHPGNRPGHSGDRPGFHRPGQPAGSTGSENRPGRWPHVGGRPAGHGPAVKPSFPPSAPGANVSGSGGPNHANRPGSRPPGSARPDFTRPGNQAGNFRPSRPSGMARPSFPGGSIPRPATRPSPPPSFSSPRPSGPSFSAPRPSARPSAAPARPSFPRPSGSPGGRPHGGGAGPHRR